MKSLLKYTDEEILAEAQQLRVGYAMKRVLRYKTSRDLSVHSESNAEHVFALIYLASYFVRVEPAGATLNIEKLHHILLFHDFGEITHGDAVSYYKSKEHIAREKEAAKEIFESLPETLGRIGYESWQEYERRESHEGKFAHALNAIEPIFELLDEVNEKSMHRLKVTFEMHLGNKIKPVENYPVMKRFVEVLSKDMNNRGVFWEDTI